MIEMQQQVSLASLTTFDIGGKARYFVAVHTEDELREALVWARERKIPFAILAGGSNVLIDDGGFDGLVIHMRCTSYSFDNLPMSDMGKSPCQTWGDSRLVADAGCNLLSLIRASAEKGLGGWEKLAGIPGSIGGAVRGNAGAFGSEIKDVVTEVRALSSHTGEIRTFSIAECDFSYRRSFFKSHPEWIIITAQVRLASDDPTTSARLIEDTVAEREKRHLQDIKAAGSYFMNPVVPQHIVEMFEREKGVSARLGRVPAGWLIEKADMKGFAVGDAQASMQHPNYIVNNGNATAADVRAVAKAVAEGVRELFDVTLREEVIPL